MATTSVALEAVASTPGAHGAEVHEAPDPREGAALQLARPAAGHLQGGQSEAVQEAQHLLCKSGRRGGGGLRGRV